MVRGFVRVLAGAMVSAAFALGACSGDMPTENVGSVSEALTSNARILNFEQVGTDWATTAGTLGSSTDRVEGSYSLSAVNTTNATFVSANLVNLGNVGSSLSVDVKYPSPAPNPSWLGDLTIVLVSPTLQMYWANLGTQTLQAPDGQFRRYTFALPSDVQSKLRGNSGSYSDLQVKVLLNVPSGTFLVDRIDFGLPSEFSDAGTDASSGGTSGSGGTGGTSGSSGSGSGNNDLILGFESAAKWHPSTGTVALSDTHLQGAHSVALSSVTYAELTSDPLTSLSNVGSVVGFDLSVPDPGGDVWWWGTVSLTIDVPSRGINNRWIGQQQLDGSALDRFRRVELTLPDDVKSALQQSYSDLRVKIALSVPANSGPYLFDRLTFSPQIAEPAPPAPSEAVDKTLGMETLESWKASSGTLNLSSTATKGASSIAVSNFTYTDVTSSRLSSLGTQIKDEVAFDLWIPTPPNQYWTGSAAIAINLPSQGINWEWIGQQELQSLPKNVWQRIKMPMSSAMVQKLKAGYSDLQIKVSLNREAQTAPWLIDNITFGQKSLPLPPVPPPGIVSVLDYVVPLPKGRSFDDVAVGQALLRSTTDGDVAASAVAVNAKLNRLGSSVHADAFAPRGPRNLLTLDLRSLAEVRNAAAFWDLHVAAGAVAHGSIEAGHLLQLTSGSSVGSSAEGVDLKGNEAGRIHVEFPRLEESPDATVPANGELALDPGDYDFVTAGSAGRLKLSTGTYRIKQLNLPNGSYLDVDNASGPVLVHVRTSLIARASTYYSDDSKTNFLVTIGGGQSADVGPLFRGTVVAGGVGTLNLVAGTYPIRGSFFGRLVDAGGTINFEPFKRDDCSTQPCGTFGCNTSDRDADGLYDCDEENDNDAWTDPDVFNGVHARDLAACRASDLCTPIDTATELDACVSAGTLFQEQDLYKGWNTTALGFPGCDDDMNFWPAWSTCVPAQTVEPSFQVDYNGYIKFAAGGKQCFQLYSDDGTCGALYLNGAQGALTTNDDAQCFDVTAGVYPIRWFLSGKGAFRLAYCAGESSTCTPIDALPQRMLRPAYDTQTTCATDSDCLTGSFCSQGGSCVVDGTPCTADEQCPAGLRCGGGECVEPPCDHSCAGRTCGDTNDCGETCGGLCEQGDPCGTQVECAAGLLCLDGVCRPRKCGDFALDRLACGDENAECGVCPTCALEGGCVPPNLQSKELNVALVSTVPGSIPGGFAVSGSGSATYSIDLSLPPGRGHMTPALALSYDSSAKSDILGDGWRLGGLSYITLCDTPATDIHDVVRRGRRGVRGDGADSYCIDGQRLIIDDLITDDDPTTDEYGTLVPDFRKVVAYGQGKNGEPAEWEGFGDHDAVHDGELRVIPRYFKVYTGDGRVFTYGDTDDASAFIHKFHGDKDALRKRVWAITNITDASGNTIDFTYFSDWSKNYSVEQCNGGDPSLCGEDHCAAGDDSQCGTLELFPTGVQYGGWTDGTTVEPHTRRVELTYQQVRRTNAIAYVAGTQIHRTRRLSDISVYIHDQPVRRYALRYATQDNQGDKLDAVYDCVVDGTSYPPDLHDLDQLKCKEPTVFEYVPAYKPESAFSGPVRVSNQYIFSPSFEDAPETAPIVLDRNGDGKDDLLLGVGYPGIGPDAAPDSGEGGQWAVIMGSGEVNSITVHALELAQPRLALANADIRSGLVGNQKPYQFGPIGDFDWDGRADAFNVAVPHVTDCDPNDLTCNDDRTNAEVLLGAPTPNFFTNTIVQTSAGADGPLVIPGVNRALPAHSFSDVDGDGITDFIYFDQNKVPHWRRGHDDGTYESERSLRPSDNPVFSALDPNQSLDIDGDGAAEFLYKQDVGVGGSHVYQWFANDPYGDDGVTAIDYFDDWVASPKNGQLCENQTRFAKTSLDVNGDGLADLLVRGQYDGCGSPKDERSAVTLRLNTGRGVTTGEEILFDMDFVEFASIRAIDFDNDGLQDFIAYNSTAKLWYLYRSLGSGFAADRVFEANVLGTFAEPGIPAPGMYSHQVLTHTSAGGGTYVEREVPWSAVADINGDGVEDFLYLAPPEDDPDNHQRGQMVVMFGQAGNAHMLSAVTDGVGERTEIEYSSSAYAQVSDQSVDSEPAHCWPAVCLKKVGRPPVLRVTDKYRKGPTVKGDPISPDSGTPATQGSTEYLFRDARTDAAGRGWVGFGSRTEMRRGAQGERLSTQVTTYDNFTYISNNGNQSFYEFAGYPTSIVTTMPRVSAELATAGYKDIKTVVDFSYDESFRSVYAKGGEFFAWLTQRTASEYNGDTLVSQEVSIFDVDEFGQTVFSRTRSYGGKAPETVLREVEENTTSDDAFFFDRLNAGQWFIPPRKRSTTRMTNSAEPTDAEGRSVQRAHEFTYDSLGRVTAVEREPCPTGESNCTENAGYYLKTSSTYNKYGLVNRITVEDKSAQKSRISTIDAFDEDNIYPTQTTRGVDTTPSLARSTSTVWDPRFGVATQVTDLNQLVSTTTYDDFGRIRSTATPSGDGSTVNYEYATPDESGMLPVSPTLRTIVCNKSGGRSVREVDSFGRVVRTRSLGLPDDVSGSNPVLSDCNGDDADDDVITEYSYNSKGSLEGSARPHARGATDQGIITRNYNNASELLSVDFPVDGGEAPRHIEYQTIDAPSAASPFSAYADSPWAGHVTQLRDARGNLSFTVSDVAGRRLATISSTSGRLNYDYDGAGRLRGASDEVGHTWGATYDVVGREISVTDPNHGSDAFTYTTFDELESHTFANGEFERYKYDDLGRIKRQVSQRDGRRCWFYDEGDYAMGRITREIAGAGCGDDPDDPVDVDDTDDNAVAYTYDALGRQHSAIHQVDGQAFAVEYGYTGFGQLEKITYPEYAGNTFAVTYEYDGRTGSVLKARDADNAANVYWKLKRAYQHYLPKEEAVGPEATTTFDYHPTNGRLLQILTEANGGQLADDNYTYDENGNLSTREDKTRAGTFERFKYDQSNRLASVHDENYATQLSIHYDDKTGNIRDKSDLSGTYTYAWAVGDGYAPNAVSSIGDDYTFEYDDFGNQNFRQTPEGSQTLEYTLFGLPRNITSETGTETRKVRYEYNTLHGEVARYELDSADPGVVTSTRIYVGSLYEHSTDEASPEEHHLYRVMAAGRQVAQLEATTDLDTVTQPLSAVYLHRDVLGSTELVTDEGGALVRRQQFSPFGELDVTEETSSSPEVRVGYTGHEQENDFGLVNMGGRFYDPKIGRMLSQDPMAAPGFADNLNAYSYVMNNPMTLVDPSGFDPPKKDTPPPPKDDIMSRINACAAKGGKDPKLCTPQVIKWAAEAGIHIGGKGKPKPNDPATPGGGDEKASSGAGGDDGPAGGDDVEVPQAPPPNDPKPIPPDAVAAQKKAQQQAQKDQEERQQKDWEAGQAGMRNGILNAWQRGSKMAAFLNPGCLLMVPLLERLKADEPTDARSREQYEFASNGAGALADAFAAMATIPGEVGVMAEEAAGEGGTVLYRIITEAESEANFVSNAAKGLAPRGPEVKDAAIHAGLSMFDSIVGAAAKVPSIERFGRKVLAIAEVRIPAGAEGVTVAKTLGRGHYTVTGAPGTVSSFWSVSWLKW